MSQELAMGPTERPAGLARRDISTRRHQPRVDRRERFLPDIAHRRIYPLDAGGDIPNVIDVERLSTRMAARHPGPREIRVHERQVVAEPSEVRVPLPEIQKSLGDGLSRRRRAH